MSRELPVTWTSAHLGDIGEWGSGGTPSRKNPLNYGGAIPWLKIGDLSDGPVLDVEETISQKGLDGSSAKLLEPGMLLVAMYGSIGKLGITTTPCATNQAIAFCQPYGGIDLRYLFYLLMGDRHRLLDQGQGGTQLNISQTILKAHDVPVAPSIEQKRIVSKIDELFSRIDEGERALARVEKLVERYRQSVLKAAVTGELTRDWCTARKATGEPLESGQALLERILVARREAWEAAELAKLQAKDKPPANDAWKKKYKPPQSPDATDLPDLPEGWVWATIEQLCLVDTGATPKRGNPRYYEGGTINWVTSASVNDSVVRTASEKITPAAIEETNAKVFPSGTLIVAMYGEGKTRGKVTELGIEAATNQACAGLLCTHLGDVVKSYLRLFLEKNYLSLRGAAAGGVQPNLNLKIIKSLAVALPPLSEQEQVIDRVQAVSSDCDEIGTCCTTEMARSAALRQSILKAAFAGQLVPQDPNDEPASALLERIAAERATTASAKARRGRKRADSGSALQSD